MRKLNEIFWVLKQLNINFYLLLIVFFLCLGGSGLYYHEIAIPEAEEKAKSETKMMLDVSAMPKQPVAMIKKGEVVSRYTQLTTEILQNKIEVREVPVMFIVDGAIGDLSSIKDKFARVDLSSNQQLTINSLSDQKDLFGHYDRLKEFPVNNLVANRVAKGSIVDLTVNYGNGDYDVVLSKKRVVDLVKSKETSEDKSLCTMVFEVNELEYRDLKLAQKLGIFEVRLYLDDKQQASPKTFNYLGASSRASIQPNTGISVIEETPPNDPNSSGIENVR